MSDGSPPAPGDEAIDANGGLLSPPLINGHTHAAMTLLRGYGDDLPLMRWLEEKVWPIEAKLEAEDVYWGARLACVEMIRTGTSRFWDMYWHPEATARAVRDAGLPATIGGPLFDVGRDAAEMRESALRDLEELKAFERCVEPALAPHAIYTAIPRNCCAGRVSWPPSAAPDPHPSLRDAPGGG